MSCTREKDAVLRHGQSSLHIYMIQASHESHLGGIDFTWSQTTVQLRSELALLVLKLLPVLVGIERWLHRQPIWSVCSLLGNDVHFDSIGLEDIEWVKGFADEDSGRMTVMEGCSCGSDGDQGSSRWRHIDDDQMLEHWTMSISLSLFDGKEAFIIPDIL